MYRRLIAGLAIAGSLLVPQAVLAREAAPLHLGVSHTQFHDDFVCIVPRGDDGDCSLATASAEGNATSNLSTGPGSVAWDFVIRLPDGFSGCFDIDESATFSFAPGTISTFATHVTCPGQTGLGVDATFTVIGGTGAFSFADGGGQETSAHVDPAAWVFNGTISY